MKITKFVLEYTDTPWKDCDYIDEIHRLFKMKLYTDTNEGLKYEKIISCDDFASLLDKLFDDAKYQIKGLLKGRENE